MLVAGAQVPMERERFTTARCEHHAAVREVGE